MASVLIYAAERHISRLFQVNLERQGYAISLAATADEAIEALSRHREDGAHVDLAILEARSPADGYEVLSLIRTQPETSAMRLVLLVPKGEIDSWRTMEFKADDYLELPSLKTR